jgi:hypothetical protein
LSDFPKPDRLFVRCFTVLGANARWGRGPTLIDGTGRTAIADSVVVIRDSKLQEVGKRAKFRFLRKWKPSMLRVNRIRVSPEFLINERLAVKPERKYRFSWISL